MPDPHHDHPDGPSLHDLVRDASQGDGRAWRLLVHRFKRLVYSIPRSYHLPDSLCDDVFQSVFTALIRELPNILDPAALPKWLITSTHRECWKASKSASRFRPASDSPTIEQHPAPAFHEHWEARLSLDHALTTLGGRCERLLRLLYLTPHSPPYEQAAASLNMPLGSIGPTRARCLSKLAELLPADRSQN